MKERGILFRAEMVRAILDGRKTQTRRVISEAYYSGRKDGVLLKPEILMEPPRGLGVGSACTRYGVPGDRLWVRETWRSHLCFNEERVYYRADGEVNSCDRCGETLRKWTPAIHMPRRASRVTLQIENIRVERVSEISVQDAIAEGIDLAGRDTGDVITAYRKLWDTMRAGTEFAWDKNPWVWIIEFRRVS
jgi:hypothetical protein